MRIDHALPSLSESSSALEHEDLVCRWKNNPNNQREKAAARGLNANRVHHLYQFENQIEKRQSPLSPSRSPPLSRGFVRALRPSTGSHQDLGADDAL